MLEAREPLRPVPCDDFTRSLFERLACEVHPIRVRELFAGLHPQDRRFQRGFRQFRRMMLTEFFEARKERGFRRRKRGRFCEGRLPRWRK